ncbi:LysR family transcriptional regulator [Pigmentiphaga kullae]|uniref:DNA-binding transcriptional LysR family regulator n=1 Tax=Pigmentiphaga kullae TaxID=151784 RepID=A0A4Q7NNH5_9BURK|nr:LysR family transcriptional regulator [Pigmentiphaga kullae]RZS86486.1 DNA-binding transcriptional LysR family regulator [Pigmentiphaga kullae]
MNLSLRQLQVFLHVARIGNFTRAAEKAHMTQAGLSIMIREMEKQLDCRLFDRTTRMVVLTDAGRDLLPVAQRVVGDLEEVVSKLGVAGRRARQTLRIAATPLISSNILPRVFQLFKQSHPHVELRLADTDLPQVEALVAGGEADIGLGFFFKTMAGLDRAPVGKFRLMRVAPTEGAPGRPVGTAAWASLRDVPLIGLPPANPIQRLIEPHLEKIGRGNEDRPSFNFFETLISMVEAGLGTAVIPTFALVACHRHRVATDLLTKPAVSLDLYQVTRRGFKVPPVMEDFRATLMEALPAVGG